jgi:alkylation response protein AidB-like acyl-CoA dehydrogenase
MIPFYTEKAERARSQAKEFGAWLQPYEQEMEDKREIMEDILGRLWERGYYGCLIPGQFGGMGGTLFEMCLILEELAPASPSVSLSLLIQALGTLLLEQDPNQERREARLLKIINERKLLAFALSEPRSNQFETRAEKSGEGFKICGCKIFVNQVREADWVMVMAESEPGPGIFLLEKGSAGMMVSKDFNRAVARGLSWGEIFFDQALACEDAVVGEPGEGERICESALSRTGALVSAMAIGLIESGIEMIRDKNISLPLSGRFLTESVVELEAGRALCYQASFGIDKNLPGSERLTLAGKIFTTELAQKFFSRLCEAAGAEGIASDQKLKKWLEFSLLLRSLLGSNSLLLDTAFQA